MGMNKKVLIIAYLFPPIGGGGVQRALKMAKYLGEFGWQPHVLTVEPEYHVSLDESLLQQLPAEAVIHRARELSLGRRAFLPAPASGADGAGGARPGAAGSGKAGAADDTGAFRSTTTGAGAEPPAQPVSASSWKRRLFPLLKRIKNALFIPDDQILWFPSAARKGLSVIREHGIDAIVSTSGPVTNHLIALYLKRKTGLPWIADFRDPWTQNMHRTNLRWREWLEDRLERMVHRESDLLLTVTESFVRNFQAKFGAELKRVEVIHNGYDLDDYRALADVRKPERERDVWTLVYTGILYRERNPRLFLQAVRQLIDEGGLPADGIRIRFAGVFDYPGYSDNIDCVRNLGLEPVVEVLGHLPHRRALEEMKQADLLLLIGDTAPGSGDYIPGKLFEYMAVGRPILALAMPGEAANIIGRHRLGAVADPTDLKAIKEAIMDLYREWREGTQQAEQAGSSREAAAPSATAMYERREQARMLAELLDELQESTAGDLQT